MKKRSSSKMLPWLLLQFSCWLLSWLICCNQAAVVAAIIPNSVIPSIYTYTMDDSMKDHHQQQIMSKSISNYSFIPGGSSHHEQHHTIDNSKSFYYTVDNSSPDAASTVVVDRTSSLPSSSSSSPSGCTLDRLAVYKVVLHTYWTRDLFPKHYPDWRPSAQWTKTIGRTHDSTFALFHMGQRATQGVKQFAETGKSDILESGSTVGVVTAQRQQSESSKSSPTTAVSPSSSPSSAISFTSSGLQNGSMSLSQSKGLHDSISSHLEQETSWSSSSSQSAMLQHTERKIFDEFSIPAITTGAGRSETKFFADSNHSLVSLMTRIVPSPDWFIGVDSFQLCVGGSWIDTVTIEMDPLDAGTDNGFTFTAPNWPTSPQGVIYRITSRYPAHPAGSFFYPKSKRLPPIATFQFIKLKEYELSEVFNFAEDDCKYETVKTQTHLETEHNHVEMNNELSASIERERQNEVTPAPTSITEHDRIRSKLLEKMNPMNNNTETIVPKNDKNAIMQNIASKYGSVQRKHQKRPASHRSRRPRDCRVSHWSDWSACSKSCGIGEMHRYRKIIRHGKRGGRPCPPLQQSKWCGSEKGCHSPLTYFNWSNT